MPDRKPALQIDALTAAGCQRRMIETASGAQLDRPQLKTKIVEVRPGDTLVALKLD